MKKKSYAIVVILCFTLPVILIAVKLYSLGYSFQRILPQSVYRVRCDMNSEGFGEAMTVKTFLPINSEKHQVITDFSEENTGFFYQILSSGENRIGEWETPKINGKNHLSISYEVASKALRFQLDSNLTAPSTYPIGFNKYLDPTENIQSTHPEILQVVDTLIPKGTKLLPKIRAIFDFTYSLKKKSFKGVTDALTALRLKEASCNGKSRLFVALARKCNIPARLVGGLILKNGTKKTSHQWVELFLGGIWVPFDALNNHFAYLPKKYLVLYYGDESLFVHTSDINFNYAFTIQSVMVSNHALSEELKGTFGNSYEVWEVFEQAGIPLELLKIILLLPLGALVVALCRNVIGFNTFGIFLPALIAISIMSTGYWWGLLLFTSVVVVVSFLHFPLESWGILYTPKLVVMLVFIVTLFILFSIFGFKIGYSDMAFVTLFPVVILTLSAERFARSITEQGIQRTLWIMFQTLVVMSIAYYFMNSITMESIFLAFPELFFVVVGIALLLGKWVGLRMFEWYRFRHLMKEYKQD